jgi:hypothetical protein
MTLGAAAVDVEGSSTAAAPKVMGQQRQTQGVTAV